MIRDTDKLDPLDSMLNDEEPGPLPIGPDGGFVPQMIQPEPIPAATAENMICLRGPCKYYLQIDSRFNAGNSKGTLDRVPVQKNRFCRAIPGTEVDLTDELVMDCSDWDPIDNLIVIERLIRRETWIKNNKEEIE